MPNRKIEIQGSAVEKRKARIEDMRKRIDALMKVNNGLLPNTEQIHEMIEEFMLEHGSTRVKAMEYYDLVKASIIRNHKKTMPKEEFDKWLSKKG